MNGQGIFGAAAGLDVFAVDADWPESRQVTGHGHDRTSGDSHVYLWFGSPHFDPEVAHLTVLSASPGNAETGEAMERAVEHYHYPDENLPADLPASEPVTLTVDGVPATFELWRNAANGYWIARGRVAHTDVVVYGSGTEPGELALVRVSDPTSFSNPFAFLGQDLSGRSSL
ncbi:hypothetical protein ACFZCF_16530 [Streptomyces sp. NPDC007945]|uniref:hypothetical protein n=1 Tax=Streptomyces sp. NPDC007945 TaxID=3364797 RepID=UPI0036EC00B0